MEENQIIAPEKTVSKVKSFFIGFSVAALTVLMFYIYWLYLESQEKKRVDAENAKYQIEHRVAIQDSLRQVAIVQAKYKSMVSMVHKYDSARATLRYRIGDLVYLKPDSVRAVVSEITIDSTLSVYTYILLMSNNGGIPIMSERKEKLLF